MRKHFTVMAENGQNIRLTTEMVEDVHQYRLGKLEKDVPIKTQSDFESENEYRAYLLDSYVALRHEEYQTVVRNETMKVYDLAMDGAKCTNLSDNAQVWNGYTKYINLAKSPEERQRRQEQVNDCAIRRAVTMGSMCLKGTPAGVQGDNKLHCCALTSSAVTAQISAKMGYDGDDNLLVAKYRGANPARRNNIVAAPFISQADSIQNNIKVIPEMQRGSPKNKNESLTLNQMVKTGKLGVGDSVSIKMKDGGNTSTGCHAMVIADIIKDDKGNVTSYILQANNGRCFRTVNVNDSNDFFGRRKVVDYVRTEGWANNKISEERDRLSSLSLSELEAEVVAQRSKTEKAIGDLAATESYNVQRGYYAGYGVGYIQLHNKAKTFLDEAERENLRANMGEDDIQKIPEEVLEQRQPADDREDLHASLSADAEWCKKADPYAIIAQYSLGENIFARKTEEPEKNPQELLMLQMMMGYRGRA